MPRAVGFDLDMTLVDTRRGIDEALRRLAADTGRSIDTTAIVATLGPPIQQALAPWFTPAEIPDAVSAFRRHMIEVGVVDVDALPGAAAAVDAARASGHDVVVVTSKIEPLAAATLRHASLDVDGVFGNVWGADKAGPLRRCGAICFVGDHPADMLAATRACAVGFGVTTGASSRDELLTAGAGYVATSLDEFPAWLDDMTRRPGSRPRSPYGARNMSRDATDR